MFNFRIFVLIVFCSLYFKFISTQETTTVDLKEDAREIVAKISILEFKLQRAPVSKELMREVDNLFLELNSILEKLEGDEKALYEKIVSKHREKFEEIKTKFKAYYDVYILNDDIEKKMISLESLLSNLPQRNLYSIFSKINDSLDNVKDIELKLNDDFFHHKLDKSYYQIRRGLHQLKKLDFLEKQVETLDQSINKLFTTYREMYYGEKSKLRSMGKLIEETI